MFAKERAEFALLYPHQVFKDLSEYQLRSYEIESIPPYVLGHLMCTKNEKMTAFINKIDQHLSSQKSIEQLLNIHLRFINPYDKAMLEQYFYDAF